MQKLEIYIYVYHKQVWKHPQCAYSKGSEGMPLGEKFWKLDATTVNLVAFQPLK